MTDEQLFHNAINFPASEQEGYLGNASLDGDQKKRVTALLVAHAAQDSLLDTESAAGAMRETSAESNLPKSIGDFEILRELGRGGMGVVYEARQKSLKRKVALKVLSSGLGLSSKAILRFRREAEAAGKLHHTNIVPIYTTGEEKGIHYYAMELVDGPSLDHVIKDLKQQDRSSPPDFHALQVTAPHVDAQSASDQGGDANSAESRRAELKGNVGKAVGASANVSSSISTSTGTSYFDQVATMMAEVADALDHAHEHGVIHRDVKPSNLLLGPDGRLSINDFGLARMLEQPGMTVSGEFVGSPLYMSPEQITAGRVALDHRTDIYSLGATLYEMLTLQPPFPGQSRDQVLSQILHKEAPSTRKLNRKIPIDLDTICMKAIDKDPDKRYQTAGKLAEDLRNYVNRYAISARRTSALGKAVKIVRRNPIVSMLACLLLVSLLIFYRQRQNHRKEQLATHIAIAEEYVVSGFDLEGVGKKHLQKAEKLGADKYWLALTRGFIGIQKGDENEAEEQIELALAKRHDSVAARSLQALLEMNTGNEAKYFRDLSKLASSHTPNGFEDHLYLGIAKTWVAPNESLESLELALQERPAANALFVHRAMARGYAAIDCTDESNALKLAMDAIDDCQRWLAIRPDDPGARTTLVEAYLIASNIYKRQSALPESQKMLFLANKQVALLQGHMEKMFPVNTTYYYMQSAGLYDAAAEFIRERAATMEEGKNYVNAYALTACFQQEDAESADELYQKIIENVGATKNSFLFLAKLAGRPTPEQRRDLLNQFLGYIEFKHDKEFFTHFEEDWLVLRLLDAPPEKATEVARRAGEYFRACHFPMQSDLGPVCEFLAGTNSGPTKLLASCQHSRRALTNAHFAIAIESLVSGDRPTAQKHFRLCVEQGEFHYYVHQWSLAFLEKWKDTPMWPTWRGGIPAKQSN